jgi:hypothetical protein
MSEKDMQQINRDGILHDYFNVIALTILVFVDYYYLYTATEFHKIGTNELGRNYGDLFKILFLLFDGYLLIDIVWIWLIPHCVKGPNTIILHHITTSKIICGIIIFCSNCAGFLYHM